MPRLEVAFMASTSRGSDRNGPGPCQYRQRARSLSTSPMSRARSTPCAPYDRLASRFGIMFFDNPRCRLSNLASWLVLGGRFAFAVWSPGGQSVDHELRDAVCGIVDVPPPDPKAPAHSAMPGVTRCSGFLTPAGLSDLGISDWRGPIPLGGGLPVPDTVDFTLQFSFGQRRCSWAPMRRH